MTDLIPQRLALIDIDNGSAAAIDGVLTEQERYGRSDILLAFGDHEHTSAGWREACIRGAPSSFVTTRCWLWVPRTPLTLPSSSPPWIFFTAAASRASR